MAATKIHCDYYELFGADWGDIDDNQARLIIKSLEEMHMLGEKPDMHGFVGTTSDDTVVGGFFAVQYPASLLHYDELKRLNITSDAPFERLFFIFFAKTGKLILQNRKFADLPLSMDSVLPKITNAFSELLIQNKLGFITNIDHPTTKEIPPELFQEEYLRSEKVKRLRIFAPDPEKIPVGFVYYNPHFDKNEIIRGSHKKDYEDIEEVDLEAKPNGDLKNTHIAKDLIKVGIPKFMRYVKNGRDHTLHRTLQMKFELYVDLTVVKLSLQTLISTVNQIKTEIGLPVDTSSSSMRNKQIPLFRFFEDNNDEK